MLDRSNNLLSRGAIHVATMVSAAGTGTGRTPDSIFLGLCMNSRTLLQKY